MQQLEDRWRHWNRHYCYYSWTYRRGTCRSIGPKVGLSMESILNPILFPDIGDILQSDNTIISLSDY